MVAFFAELKRRHVFKVAATYVVTGWLVAQAAEFLLENFAAPQWVLQAIVIVLILGFPIAVVLAWAFELTPDGVQRDSADEVQRLPEVTGLPTLLPVDIPSQSIAVLPFADMSPDRDQEYFSDGLTEELLNLLAKVPGLHVASRTSAFSFKGKQEDIRDIAEKLRVRHVLEGSVRKAGDQLRITVQLIKASDGYHLWSENYDRSMANIFAIQDEIARAVVESLKPQLLDETPVAQETSSEAYNLYLQALHYKRQRTPDSLDRAMDLLERAVAIDPEYAPAWALLSSVYAVRGGSAQAGWKVLGDMEARRFYYAGEFYKLAPNQRIDQDMALMSGTSEGVIFTAPARHDYIEMALAYLLEGGPLSGKSLMEIAIPVFIENERASGHFLKPGDTVTYRASMLGDIVVEITP